MPKFRQIPKNSLIAFDQLVNALLWGWPDETFSSRCWRLRKQNRLWSLARLMVDVLFFFDTDHCRTSFESERGGRHLPPEARS